MTVTAAEFVRINTKSARLAKEPTPYGSVWRRDDLKLSNHALELRLEQGRILEASEEDYTKFLSGESVVEEVVEEVKAEIQEEVEKLIEEEAEELGSYVDPPPGSQEQTRDGNTIIEWWVEHKVTDDDDAEGNWGAFCPFNCAVDDDGEPTGEKRRHRHKSKLFNCCRDKSKWAMAPMKTKQSG